LYVLGGSRGNMIVKKKWESAVWRKIERKTRDKISPLKREKI
jgi:hypothetical protein